MMISADRLAAAYETARRDLLVSRTQAGHWTGELASSALSTATATSALALVARATQQAGAPRSGQLIAGGLKWLAAQQNDDGGFGDTDKSLSNISTTMLVQAAVHLAGAADGHQRLLRRAADYVARQGGVPGLRRRYGKDKTFAVPILTNCALAGLVSWDEVDPLPFELACLPHAWYRWLRLHVVSYAIPALVAIGQARFFHRRPGSPLVRWWRSRSVDPSLRVLEAMQPASGGFLEATPLTSFVVMSLASIGQARHPVVRRGVEFLIGSVRQDGSWPIDTNLATWVTTLSTNALAAAGEDVSRLDCLDWILSCQCSKRHPYTHAAPGGWGWSDLSGSVPDADDTPGALLALAACDAALAGRLDRADSDPQDPAAQADVVLADQRRRIHEAAALGVGWLLDLQNRDGGWPTFCRGWGRLPFDRSGTDLTAHALRALRSWQIRWSAELRPVGSTAETALLAGLRPGWQPAVQRAVRRGFSYLARSQQPDGSWLPLWFGNQYQPDDVNPFYGTARVLLGYRDFSRMGSAAADRGLGWLRRQQNADGGWGGHAAPGADGSSVEETALAVEALLAGRGDPAVARCLARGLRWLVESVEAGRHQESTPIGFYFARLWYYERLYPLIFTVGALGQALQTSSGANVSKQRAPRLEKA